MELAIDALSRGEIIAYPTDSLFAIGCDPWQKKAVVALCRIKNLDPAKANLSYLCPSMTNASKLIKQLDKEVYKFINRNTPGPLTFILEAGKTMPHHFRNKRRTIGIRIPDHYLLKMLLSIFEHPLLTTSLPSNDEEELLYPEELVDHYKDQLSIWIDDEHQQNSPSSVIDCTNWPPEIIRNSGHEIVW
ncbi:MAG: threonylcarbamoyl-AMP synthase [Saprospiraceae bacterium]|nr:threonylcarbamoyl-AMP synthase [Saprospiraceae bacterium]